MMDDIKHKSESTEQLIRLAHRLEANDCFIAWALATYRKQEKLNDRELSEQLGASDELLTRLALCKRPNSASPQFADQVRKIAEYSHVDVARLAMVLRQVESLHELSKRPRSEATSVEPNLVPLRSGLLAAARDHDESEEPESPEDKDNSKPE
ncbi:hypothetical protein ANRL1_04441 [Anaerolineae bacterium]|nr:hypothetical protein ANRL1_04441 [Anaerolineae bacterium]